MFGDIISKEVVFSRGPIHDKLTLCNAVTDPMEAHIDCFASLGLDFVVGKSYGGRVVGLHWCWWWWWCSSVLCSMAVRRKISIVSD